MLQTILGPLFADTYTSCCRDIQLVCGESQPCSMQFLVSSCVFIFCNLNGSAEIYSDCLETKGVIYTSWKHNLIQDGCESVARGWLLGTCKLPVSFGDISIFTRCGCEDSLGFLLQSFALLESYSAWLPLAIWYFYRYIIDFSIILSSVLISHMVGHRFADNFAIVCWYFW